MIEKILIVQDSPTINRVLRSRLESSGFLVDICETGEKGVEKAKADNYQLILLDCTLPGISGMEVCRFLKKEEKFKNIPVVFMSGEDENKLANIVKNEGADGYISFASGFDGKEFIVKVKNFLDNKDGLVQRG